ncbi:mechanosensitive ion channel, partial [Candidatus Uhrbacteria bacterium]|nr:mechanosensitive ion channel [Candidatus Uhrbacteria bacterium]MBD3284360.1 mechanosensitive ion channel [Candidatus Uhrbacteria bacterium]
MFRGVFLIILSSLLAVLTWAAGPYIEIPYRDQFAASFLSIAIGGLLYQVIVRELILRAATQSKMRYGIRKALSTFIVIVVLAVILTIWIRETQALLIGYGVLAAGLAFAFQDVFKNLAGSLVLFLTRPYAIGDRVEIDGVQGDV